MKVGRYTLRSLILPISLNGEMEVLNDEHLISFCTPPVAPFKSLGKGVASDVDPVHLAILPP